MPDITMCKGIDCPHKESCHRFTAKPDEYQSYFVEAPIKEGKCDMYWGDAEAIWNQLKEITNQNNMKLICLLCGRNKFTHQSPHQCKGGYRKRKIKWAILDGIALWKFKNK